ncbi:Hpt domain-containing protein [Massilia sp. IC2-477]|uniref:Hpt domain-containing protein n=1 Tax=Massilia sp. IC2-477 TaxID=2887198 RepID=UPI001D107E44|nr:Hpt domain-containing protein [Massilia sp. IC2-477]
MSADLVAAADAPALDIAAGVERMMGDAAMYLRILARFRSDYTGYVARLRTALAGGDLTLAHRVVHTLKGAAAMIEARGLRAAAVEVEQQLRGGAHANAHLVDRMEAELARVMAQVDSLMAAQSAGDTAGAQAMLAERDLRRLRALLDVGDSGAQNVIAENRSALRTRLGAARMAELEKAVAAFDYERALGVLDAQ